MSSPHPQPPLPRGEGVGGEGNLSVCVILAFLANLDEERGELVNGSKDIRNGLVEFIYDVFAMLSSDGIVPAISRGIPLHASRLLRIVDLASSRSESHIIALPS
jgi:hypothetical protein